MRSKMFFLVVLTGLGSNIFGQEYEIKDSVLYHKAVQLCKDYTIIDSHIDLPIWMYDEWIDLTQDSGVGEIDFPRAVKGGLDAAFMAIYTSPELEGTGRSKIIADSLIRIVEKIASEWPDKFAVVKSTAELNSNLKNGKILLPMGMENGSPIEGDLNNLEDFYKKGIRYITLCHMKSNHISDSSTDPDQKWNGLSPFGEEVISEMNRLGIMIDVSHISDSAFYDVMKLSRAPVIASHSSCRFFVPSYQRNINDDMIKLLASKGGVVQINFGSFFLVDSIYQNTEKGDLYIKAYLDSMHISHDSSAAYQFSSDYYKKHPAGRASVKDVVDHIDHIVKIAGIDYVGLGSDFNGLGDFLPFGLRNVSEYPNLVYELLLRGYKDNDIKKILGENFLRVWKQVEEVSKQ